MEPASAPAWDAEDGEWELFNDDGFIYKRKKRRRLTDDPAAVVDASKKPDPVVDPEVEEKRRKERKRTALVKLKRKYQKEMDQWELLSNTLTEMQEKWTLRCREQREEGQQRGVVDETASVLGSSGVVQRTEDASGSLLDELLLQAEAQEAIIRDVSNLCDVSEAMCNVLEERLKQSYFDLPIWESPHELMASLCDE